MTRVTRVRASRKMAPPCPPPGRSPWVYEPRGAAPHERSATSPGSPGWPTRERSTKSRTSRTARRQGQEVRRHLEPGRGAAVDHALGSRARPHRQFPGDAPAEPERPLGALHLPAGHGGGRGTEPLRAVREPRVPGLRQERNARGLGLPPEQPVHERRRRLRRRGQRRSHRPLRSPRGPLDAQPVRLDGASNATSVPPLPPVHGRLGDRASPTGAYHLYDFVTPIGYLTTTRSSACGPTATT